MEVLLVRHGESTGNAAGRLQGQADYPLTDLGKQQARRLAKWLVAHGFGWDAAYCSPLSRARDTALALAESRGLSAPIEDVDLKEVDVGELEGMERTEIADRHPSFMQRDVTDLGDFSEYGGESYDAVQQRIGRFMERLKAAYRGSSERILVVAHGGLNFQLVKAAICIPVPRVCILRWGNCSTTLLKFRERRNVLMAEIAWHLPLEMMGGVPGGDSAQLFR